MLKKKSQVKDKGNIINLKIIVRLVVILVDGLRNYMTKHLSKDWMIENKFLSVNEYNDENCKFKGLELKDLNLKKVKICTENTNIEEALNYFKYSD